MDTPDFAKTIIKLQEKTMENMNSIRDMIAENRDERDVLADQLATLLLRERVLRRSPLDMSLNEIMLARGLTQEQIDEPDTVEDDPVEPPEWWIGMSDIQKKRYLDVELDMYHKFYQDSRDEPVLV
jgi:hypothetical protein